MALSQNLPMNFLAFLKIASISEVIWHYVGRKEQSSECFQISGSDLNFLCCLCHFCESYLPAAKIFNWKRVTRDCSRHRMSCSESDDFGIKINQCDTRFMGCHSNIFQNLSSVWPGHFFSRNEDLLFLV